MLLLGAVAHFAWKWAPPEAQADVWNASQALLVLALLTATAVHHPRLRAVCALLACGQALTAGCSIAWLAQPWEVLPGQAQCTALLDAPLGTIGLWLTAMMALRVSHDTARA